MGLIKFIKKLFKSNKHTCNFTIREVIHGVEFMKCDYPGCRTYDLSPEQKEKDRKRNEEFDKKMDDLLKRVRRYRQNHDVY